MQARRSRIAYFLLSIASCINWPPRSFVNLVEFVSFSPSWFFVSYTYIVLQKSKYDGSKNLFINVHLAETVVTVNTLLLLLIHHFSSVRACVFTWCRGGGCDDYSLLWWLLVSCCCLVVDRSSFSMVSACWLWLALFIVLVPCKTRSHLNVANSLALPPHHSPGLQLLIPLLHRRQTHP